MTAPDETYKRLTLRAQTVMSLSLREALQLGHNYVGTEHILLGLIREGEGVAAKALTEDLGLELKAVRRAVIQRLCNSPQSKRHPLHAALDELTRQVGELLKAIEADQ